MPYVPTTWREGGMTTPGKLDALDNLETMYSEAVSYINGILHAERYYNKTECDSRFFTTFNDGSGSGVICETLDGYTAQDIMNAYMPSGSIVAWPGTVEAIPDGWAMCNGSNGTPDLRNRFVIGAGPVHARGSSGGSNSVTTSATVAIAGHGLTRSETPLHTHSYVDRYNSTIGDVSLTSGGSQWVGAPVDHPTHTDDAGNGTPHGHPATWEGTPNQVKMPKYYALIYIMRL